MVRLGPTMGTAGLWKGHKMRNATVSGQPTARSASNESRRRRLCSILRSVSTAARPWRWAWDSNGQSPSRATSFTHVRILPQHAHLVIARCERRAEQIIAHLKGRATQQLAAEGLHPLADFREADGTIPSPWARKGWPVFLESDQRIFAVPLITWRRIRFGRESRRSGGRLSCRSWHAADV